MSDEFVLYQYGGKNRLPSLSPPCLKIELALKVLGLPHRVVNLGSPGQVKANSPTQRVPALEHRGERLSDSVAIMDRLQELTPEGPLWEEDEAARARGRLWDCFVTDSLYWLGYYQRWLVPATRDALLDDFLGPGFSIKKLGMRFYARTVLRRRAEGQSVGMRPPGEVREAYHRALDMLVAGLEGGPFLGGRTKPGRGDVSAAGHLAQLTHARELPPVARALESRPAIPQLVQAVFEAAGLPAP